MIYRYSKLNVPEIYVSQNKILGQPLSLLIVTTCKVSMTGSSPSQDIIYHSNITTRSYIKYTATEILMQHKLHALRLSCY